MTNSAYSHTHYAHTHTLLHKASYIKLNSHAWDSIQLHVMMSWKCICILQTVLAQFVCLYVCCCHNLCIVCSYSWTRYTHKLHCKNKLLWPLCHIIHTVFDNHMKIVWIQHNSFCSVYIMETIIRTYFKILEREVTLVALPLAPNFYTISELVIATNKL